MQLAYKNLKQAIISMCKDLKKKEQKFKGTKCEERWENMRKNQQKF